MFENPPDSVEYLFPRLSHVELDSGFQHRPTWLNVALIRHLASFPTFNRLYYNHNSNSFFKGIEENKECRAHQRSSMQSCLDFVIRRNERTRLIGQQIVRLVRKGHITLCLAFSKGDLYGGFE